MKNFKSEFQDPEDARKYFEAYMPLDGSKTIEEYIRKALALYTNMLWAQVKENVRFEAIETDVITHSVDVIEDARILAGYRELKYQSHEWFKNRSKNKES